MLASFQMDGEMSHMVQRRRNHLTIADLPLFASDEQLGEAVLGWERRKEFAQKASYLEKDGMPKINAFWGGRHVCSVVEFIDTDTKMLSETSLTPEQVDSTWRTLRKRRRALNQPPRAPAGDG